MKRCFLGPWVCMTPDLCFLYVTVMKQILGCDLVISLNSHLVGLMSLFWVIMDSFPLVPGERYYFMPWLSSSQWVFWISWKLTSLCPWNHIQRVRMAKILRTPKINYFIKCGLLLHCKHFFSCNPMLRSCLYELKNNIPMPEKCPENWIFFSLRLTLLFQAI